LKAIVVEDPGRESRLVLAEVEAPPLRLGALRLRVAAAGVNRGDLMQRRGLYPPPPGASEILGLECAGEVVEVADDVRGWQLGQRAMALLPGGGYAQEVVVDAGSAMPVPEVFSMEEAAAFMEVHLTVFLTVFQLASFPDAGRLLVHGGGSGIGTAATKMVKEAGGTVFVTAGSARKCARCLELGADLAIDYHVQDFVDEVARATQGQGVDVVLDSIGAAYLKRNLECLCIGGKLVLIGLMGGSKAEIDLGFVLMRRLQLIASTLRARPESEKAAIVTGLVERFGEAIAAGRLRPVIDSVLPIERAAEAHERMQSSEHFGKIVLRL